MDKVMLVIFTSKLEVFGHFIIATSIMCYKYHFFLKDTRETDGTIGKLITKIRDLDFLFRKRRKEKRNVTYSRNNVFIQSFFFLLSTFSVIKN